MTSIHQNILDEIKSNVQLKANLASLFGKTTTTIDNYCIENNPLLTTKDAVVIICKGLNKTEEEILTQEA